MEVDMKRVYVMDCGDFVKIGVSGNPEQRKRTVPFRIKKYFSTEPIKNYAEIEKFMHRLLKNFRAETGKGREYFNIDFGFACEILQNACKSKPERRETVEEGFSGNFEMSDLKFANLLLSISEEDLILALSMLKGLNQRQRYIDSKHPA